ncbi:MULTISPECIES: hypothetical protein [unclassified Mycobacterium]|uniref:hypothetical protein n=1 Tax=unclassified Mycobacterium TaxID=2642494 RepID=UPI0029C749DD|nr:MULTISPECIES: hypothetical protein [unclassified Mycobacterium]
MDSLTASGLCKKLLTTAAAGVIAGMALMGATVSANATPDDPGCDVFGWRHPMCAGGAWDESPSHEWGPANTGINPLPGGGGQMVPNTDGGLSLPGTPGAI